MGHSLIRPVESGARGVKRSGGEGRGLMKKGI